MTRSFPVEIAYCLLSAPLSPERFNEVKNRPHWWLDVVMNEDQDKSRLGNGLHNLAVLRYMALNVMQKDVDKGSLRASSSEPAGMKPTWRDSGPYFEMRLPRAGQTGLARCRGMDLMLDASLFRLVAILQGDEHSLEGPQKAETNNERQGKKNHKMDPKRRLIAQLCPKSRPEHQEAADETDEDGWAVTGISKAKIEAALAATRRDGEKTREGLALAAPWASSLEPRDKGRLRSIVRFETHPFSLSAFSAKSKHHEQTNKKGGILAALRPVAPNAISARSRPPRNPVRKCSITETIRLHR
jgi:hypothetical protein